MLAWLRSGRVRAEACKECRRGREKLFNRSETSKHVERLVGEGCRLSSPPGGFNSNLRTNYCFAYLHLAHSDYLSLAGNVTTLHLSMVHLSSEPLSQCSLICFGFQAQ